MDILSQICLDPIMARAIVAAADEDRPPSSYLLTRALEALPADAVLGEWRDLGSPGPDGAPWDGSSTHHDRAAWVAQELRAVVPEYEWVMAAEDAYRHARGHGMAERLWAWGEQLADSLRARALPVQVERMADGVRFHAGRVVLLWAIIGSDGRLLMGGEGASPPCEMTAIDVWDWAHSDSLVLPMSRRLRDSILALGPRLAAFGQCRDARSALARVLRTALATALRDEASREPMIRLTWETLSEEDSIETARAVVHSRAEFADGGEVWDGPVAVAEVTADPVMTPITVQLQLLGRLWVRHYVDADQLRGDLPRVQRLIELWSRGLTVREIFEHVATQEAGR